MRNHRFLKQALGFVLSAVLLLSQPFSALGAELEVQDFAQPDFDIHAGGVYLVNLDTDQVIYQQNAQRRSFPASMTKVMTAILILENADSLTTPSPPNTPTLTSSPGSMSPAPTSGPGRSSPFRTISMP